MPFLPGPPNPCPSTSDQTHRQHTTDTHHIHTMCYSAWNSVRNRGPAVFQGSNSHTEGHVMGTEVVRSSGVRAEELRWGALFLRKILILNISFLIGWSERSLFGSTF